MKLISYDLGTGGVKASLYDEELNTVSKSFIEYQTQYPKPGFHEQRPEDWWQGVLQSTQRLLNGASVSPEEISCISLSGHSCAAVLVDKEQNLLLDTVPIWSDTRALEETREFFQKIDEDEWYLATGNGFPPPCYAIFKLMWYRKHLPEIFFQAHKFLGSKDYINMKLTGNICTDDSYASSFGAYNLHTKSIDHSFLEAAQLPLSLFPEIVPSHTIVGHLTPEASDAIGLPTSTAVACGGVDNACMALGATGATDGKAYVSLGSSSWIPVNSSVPILDVHTRPYVFAHIQENRYTSAYSIFAGGSSFKWVKDTLCKDLAGNPSIYDEMSMLASRSPIGAGGILFNPSLAGGTSQDKSIHIRGTYVGLHLGTTREDLIRASMEGIALNLKMSLDLLAQHVSLSDELLFCGGGSKSSFWMQMFADIFDMEVIKTNIDQDAASLGAAAICARAVGLWSDYSKIPKLHKIERRCVPNKESHAQYEKVAAIFKYICSAAADIGDYMHANLTPL